MFLIRNKKTYFELAKAGFAGNSPMIWETPEEFLAESDHKVVAIRSSKPGGSFTWVVKRDKLYKTIKNNGLINGDFYLTRPIPGSEYLIAGELSWVGGDWYLHYTFVNKSMRDALREGGKHAYGYHNVWELLRRYCTPADCDDIIELFEEYSYRNNYPAIEFSVTKRNDWGIIPNRNTVIWEIRHY
jgi:hypothetical protein